MYTPEAPACAAGPSLPAWSHGPRLLAPGLGSILVYVVCVRVCVCTKSAHRAPEPEGTMARTKYNT